MHPKKNLITQLLAGIGILSCFCFIVYISGKKSMWLDDIAQIHISAKGHGLMEFFQRNRSVDSSPPLYGLFIALWLRIAPYGTRWMKLPNIIFTFLGSIIWAKPIAKDYGKRGVLFSLACCLTGHCTINLVAITVRAYGLYYLLASILVTSYYFVRYKDGGKKWQAIYTISMVMVLYTHYFSALLIFCLFCCDLYFFFRKKLTWRFLIPYFISGLLFLPWFLYIVSTTFGYVGGALYGEFHLGKILSLILSLLGAGKILLLIFLAGTTLCFVHYFSDKNDKEGTTRTFPLCLMFCIVFPIFVISIYSAFIKHNSMFLDRARYFTGTLPCVFILLGIGCEYGLQLADKLKIKRWLQNILLIIITLYLLANNIKQINRYQDYIEPYEVSIEYVMSQEDVFSKDVGFYICDYYLPDGWNYYITHNGARPGKETIGDDPTPAELAQFSKLYIIENLPLSEEIRSLLNSDYHILYTDSDHHLSIYEKN